MYFSEASTYSGVYWNEKRAKTTYNDLKTM